MEIELHPTPPKVNCDKSNFVAWTEYSSLGRVVSIPNLVDDNLEKYRGEYIALVNSLRNFKYKKRLVEDWLSCNGVSFWWGSLIQEKSIYKSPEIYTIFKFMALRDFCNKGKVTLIRTYLTDKKLIKNLSRFCKKNSIKFHIMPDHSGKKKSRSLKSTLVDPAPHFIKSFVSLGALILERRKSLFFYRDKKHLHSKATVMSYLPYFDIDKAKEGEFHSFYWGQLTDKIKGLKGGVNHLLLFAKSQDLDFNSAFELKKNLDQSSTDTFFLLEDFLCFSIIMKSIFSYLKVVFRSIRLRGLLATFGNSHKTKLPIDALLKDGWQSSTLGVCAINSSLYHELFNRYLSMCNHQELGLYVMENHGWERLFVNSWKERGNGTIIGYAHSSVREDDLRYFNSFQSIESKACQCFFPDRIAVNTERTKQIFINQGFCSDHISWVESIRYLYLGRIKKRPPQDKIQSVLVLTDINEDSARHLLKICQSAFLGKKYKIAVKPHPLLRNSQSLIEKSLTCSVTREHLEKILHKVDFVVLSSATSALLEVRAMGIAYAIVLEPDMFNLSPLPINQINTVRTAKELESLMTARDLESEPTCEFLLDESLPRWGDLIKDQYAN
jgi:surface carbohydrate biosynthesis protein (TIGR04326 family)